MYCSCAGSAAWPVKKENETALVVYHAELQMVRQKWTISRTLWNWDKGW